MSKGSKQRPGSKLKFDENYQNINWKKATPQLTQTQLKELSAHVKIAFKKDENND